jgi:hypothetical protein
MFKCFDHPLVQYQSKQKNVTLKLPEYARQELVPVPAH